MLAVLFLGHTEQRFHGTKFCLLLAVHQYVSGEGVLPADPTMGCPIEPDLTIESGTGILRSGLTRRNALWR